MKTSDYFDSDSPYAKAADQRGFNKQAIIEDSGSDVMSNDDGERKVIWIAVSCLDKPIILSKTNGRTLRDAFGGETKRWHGKRLLLTTKEYNFDSRASVGWITTPMLDEPEFDDDIPFGDEPETPTPKATKRKTKRKAA